MSEFLPPVTDLQDGHNHMLTDLPFQNEDADLYSWIEELVTSSGPQGVGEKGIGAGKAANGAALSELPSWGLPTALGDPAPDGLFKQNSDVSKERSSSSDASQVGLVPISQFALEADTLAIPISNSFASAPATPTADAPYLIPDLPRAVVPQPGQWGQQFPEVPPTLWPTNTGEPSQPTAPFQFPEFPSTPMGGVSAAAQPLSSRAESGGSSEGAREAREEREHKSSSMPKADAWKEKNRLAQRAFRQRQKEKQKASERHIEELSERVQALELEKRELQNALEKAKLAPKANGQQKSADDELALALKFGESTVQLKLTVRELKSLTLDRMIQIWKTFVQKIGQLLPEAERQPGSLARHRLEDLSFESRLLLWAMVEHNMRTLSDFIKCNMEKPGTPRVVSHDHWLDMLKKVQLTSKQQQALVAARRALLANVGALLAERERLAVKIRGIEDVEDTKDGVAIHFQELSDLCEKVRANVDAIHVCKCYYMSHAYREILTPLQCARFVYFSYPYGMDLLSLMTASAKEAGEPSTHALLRAAQPLPANTAAASHLATIDWNQAKKMAFQ